MSAALVAPSIEISVVIPAYRSAEILPDLMARLIPVLEQLRRSYEVVVVEDHSPDDTWKVLLRLREQYGSRMTLIRLRRNAGQHNALMCGLRHARGAILVTMDDDLQHPPEEIPRLIEHLEQGRYELVYGRYAARRHNLFRQWMSAPVGLFFLGVFRSRYIPTSFRAIHRDLAEAILYYRGSFTVLDGLLAWHTERVGGIHVEHARRARGKSTYSFFKLLNLAFDVFTNTSLSPLRFMSLAGALLLILGMAGLLMSAATSLGRPPMNANVDRGFVLAAHAMFAGMQCLAVGLLGEYVGRTHLNINRRPQYLVESLLPPDGAPPIAAEAHGEPSRTVSG